SRGVQPERDRGRPLRRLRRAGPEPHLAVEPRDAGGAAVAHRRGDPPGPGAGRGVRPPRRRPPARAEPAPAAGPGDGPDEGRPPRVVGWGAGTAPARWSRSDWGDLRWPPARCAGTTTTWRSRCGR